jgi:hypothetical protein
MNRVFKRLVVLPAIVICLICLGQQTSLLEIVGVASAKAASNDQGYTGDWVGKTVSGSQGNKIAGKVRNIVFHIKQAPDGQIKGTYNCKSGKDTNSFCRNFQESGTIAGGKIADGNWQVTVIVHPDSSSCEYQGKLSGEETVQGEYTCTLQGTTIVDKGTWQAKKRSKPVKS